MAEATLRAQDKALQDRIDAVNSQLQQLVQAEAALPPNASQRVQYDPQIKVLDSELFKIGDQQNQLRATVVTAGRIIHEPPIPSSPSSPNSLVTLSTGVGLGLL